MSTFDTEIKFEELPLKIGSTTVALFTGTVGLIEDPGYGFIIDDIQLNDTMAPSGAINIHANHDDAFVVELYGRLSSAIMQDEYISDQFEDALWKYMRGLVA